MLGISGNHDHGSKNLWHKPAVTYLTQLAIAFPERFILLDNSAYAVNEHTVITGIPYYEYTRDYELALDSAIEYIADNVKNILLIHQTPTGLGNAMIPTDTDINDLRYENFDLVLCGHIHHKKIITDKFVIMGNPLHQEQADRGDEKGVWLYDTEDPAGTLTFISRKGRYPEFVTVPLGTDVSELENDYVTIQVEEAVLIREGEASVEHFSNQLTREVIMSNYIDKVDAGNEELLKIGLEFIN